MTETNTPNKGKRTAQTAIKEVDTPTGIHIGNGYYDEIEFVGEVRKGRNMLTVIRARKDARWSLRIQEWWQTDDMGWAPAKNGMSLPIDKSDIYDLIQKGFDEA